MIRPLDPSHRPTAEALVALQRAAYAVEAELAGIRDFPALRETAEELAAAGLRILAVVEPAGASPPQAAAPLRSDEDVVACLAYARVGNAVEIERLVVHPRAFRRGLASSLLAELTAREPDARRQIVATAARNGPGLALYGRHGFVVTGERVVGDGVPVVDLERVLPSRR